jgi:predicted ester cyclase/heme-degrading monooxygenase HmoA
MKSILKIAFVLWATIISNQSSFSQVLNKSLKKSDEMEIVKNKETILFLYDSILNKKHFEKLSTVVSTDYINAIGEKGVEGFQKSIFELSKAFPDAQWKVEEIISDGKKVMVIQKFIGTQINSFQNIKATNKAVSADGIAIYELQKGKIIHSQVQTDRLGFLQQLGVLPIDVSTVTYKREIPNAVNFIDKFIVPTNAIAEFTQRMNLNRGFIKTLPGFIKDEVYVRTDEDGNQIIITIAVWENEVVLKKAKEAVQAEYKKEGFDPAEMLKRLNITMDRGTYQKMDN